MPLNSEGLREPLHAVYRKTALDVMRSVIGNGEKSILQVLDSVDTKLVQQEEFSSIAGALSSFSNVNTPDEYEKITGQK